MPRPQLRDEDKTDVFRGLACPLRRELLTKLGAGEKSARELQEGLDLTQPALSRHMRVLVDTGLVTCRAEGVHRYYSRNTAALKRARQWMQRNL